MAADHRSPLVRLVVLVAGQVLALGALLAAGARAPVAGAPWVHGFARWFTAAPPVDAVAVVMHRAALVVAAWLLVTTTLHAAAALTRVPSLVRATAWAALPAARRAVAAVVVTAGVLAPTAAGAASGAAAHETTVGSRPVRDGRAATSVTTATATTATTPAAMAPAAADAPPVTAPASAGGVASPAPAASGLPTVPAPARVVVQAGDSLWTIAAHVVAAEQGRPVEALSPGGVAARWVAIRDANAARLRSGDVSVIYPGEEVVVPE